MDCVFVPLIEGWILKCLWTGYGSRCQAHWFVSRTATLLGFSHSTVLCVCLEWYTIVMTLHSLGTACPIPLSLPPPCVFQLGCCGQREVVNSWGEDLLMATQYRERVKFHREQNNLFYLTELEVWTTFTFRRRYSIKDRWRIQLRTGPFVTAWGSSWETV